MSINIKSIIVFCLALSFSSAGFSEALIEDPIERKMLDIAIKLRCTVCQNQPVSESNSGLAIDMRNLITEKLKEGKEEPEIVKFFVDRYGDYVLLKPPQSGNGLLLWVMPPILLLFSVVLAVVLMKSRDDKQAAIEFPALSDEDKQRVRRAREEDVMQQNKFGEDR